MPRLYVNVRFHDVVVDDKVCTVRDEVLLGDYDEAKASFPGARLRVLNRSGRLSVLGRTLHEGQQRTLRFGDVQLSLERVGRPWRAERTTMVPDLRLLVATAAIILFSGFIDTVSHLLDQRSTQLAAVSSSVEVRSEEHRGLEAHGAGSAWRYGAGSASGR